MTGTLFLMWLGEQITERGIGNGISIIIFSGIAANLPHSVGSLFDLVRVGSMNPLVAIVVCLLIAGVTAGVVFVERGQRKILVNYAKRQVGNKVYGGQSSHLPLKLNMSGVIPPIFASSIILFPATAAQWFGSSDRMHWLKDIAPRRCRRGSLFIFCCIQRQLFYSFSSTPHWCSIRKKRQTT